MNLSNYFWYFKSALTPRFCDEVIKYALKQKDGIARTGGFNKPKLSHIILSTLYSSIKLYKFMSNS